MYNQHLLELLSEDNIYYHDYIDIMGMHVCNKHPIAISSNNKAFCNIRIFALLTRTVFYWNWYRRNYTAF